MRSIVATAIICMVCAVLCVSTISAGNTSGSDELTKYVTNLPFSPPKVSEPVFPDRRVSIAEYGAVADGRTLNTKAFSDAIGACSKAGGGTVIVPPGMWLTGPIQLVSNINLHLEQGALLEFSHRFEDFPLIAGLNGKSKRFMVAPPIHAYRATNIAITGEGVIDGAGEFWRPVKKEKQTQRQWKELTESGGSVAPDGKVWWPSREAMEAEEYLGRLENEKNQRVAADYAKAREYLRPNLVELVQCNGILLDGPTFRNSPRFHVHPAQSENIIVRNVKIVTGWDAQNGDGLDLSACRNVLVYKTTVDAGDDAICIKPGKIGDNQSPGPSCENIVIADCIVYHGHGGFVVGSESYGGAKDIAVKNCIFVGTDVGLRFKSARGKGGLVEDIFADSIQMRGIVNEAILFDMSYGGGSPEEEADGRTGAKTVEPVSERTPQFRNISITNIVCDGASRAVLINGLPEMPVKNIRIENISVVSNRGALCIDADSIVMVNAALIPLGGPIVAIDQSSNITLDKITFPRGAETFLTVSGEKTKNVRLVNTDLSLAKKELEIGKGAKSEAVVRR